MNPFDAHFSGASRILAEHSGARGVVSSRDGIAVTAVGAGGAAFNPAMVVGEPADPHATVTWARDALRATGRPYCLQVPGEFLDSVGRAFDAAGLKKTGTMPGMVRPVRDEEPELPPGLRIERVRDAAELEAFAVATATGFEMPDPSGAVEALGPSLVDDERVTMLTGYLDGAGTPCATAVSVFTAGIAGLFAITCHPHARRRGIGAAMTLAAAAAGARRGATTAALQASPMGEPVYRRLGFESVREYHMFEPC